MICNNFFSEETKLDEISSQEESSSKTFAIYVNDGNDNYTEYDGDSFPLKVDGYKFNAEKTRCKDKYGKVVDVTVEYRNDMIQLTTTKNVFCTVYFDLYSAEGDWCLVNNITDKLGECAIVMDDYSYTVESAKTSIEAKGEATTSEISPTITFKQTTSTVSSSSGCVASTTDSWVVGPKFSFDSSTGIYTVLDAFLPTTLNDLGSGTYYTCLDKTGISCSEMYRILSYKVTTASTTTTQCITKATVYTYKESDSFDSEYGMYATTDDYGTTYFYRGTAKNNYVYFAGFYWRIIRVNGDGSVRLIYQGKNVDSTGSDATIGSYQFNPDNYDPTFVGYMYGDRSSTAVTQNGSVDFVNYSLNTIYYFGTSYTTTSDKKFKLTGSVISGTLNDLFGPGKAYASNIKNYYTCFGTSSTDTCTVLMKLNSYVSESWVNLYFISFASTSYEATLTNKNSSPIKEIVDKWYVDNLKSKYSSYLADTGFCGDRSLDSTYPGAGYLLYNTTYYMSSKRNINLYKPSLECPNPSSDLYTVSNSKGNKALTYPIGLITADEVAFAGGKYFNVNTLYYLYIGEEFFTMSPSRLDPYFLYALEWLVQESGSMYDSNATSHLAGVRPVINLSSDVTISSGTGTASNPFIVKT